VGKLFSRWRCEGIAFGTCSSRLESSTSNAAGFPEDAISVGHANACSQIAPKGGASVPASRLG
jgi:hypothetical protein